jgi:hypothetical protein
MKLTPPPAVIVPFLLVAVVLGMLFMSACAAGPNPLVNEPRSTGESAAGFWLGLWHGLICPITFVISLFSDTVQFYEVHNNGGWYNSGFLLGAASILAGSGNASSTGTRRD